MKPQDLAAEIEHTLLVGLCLWLDAQPHEIFLNIYNLQLLMKERANALAQIYSDRTLTEARAEYHAARESEQCECGLCR